MYPEPGPPVLRDLFIITTNSINIFNGLVLASLGFIVQLLLTPKTHSMYNSRFLAANNRYMRGARRINFIVLNARVALV